MIRYSNALILLLCFLYACQAPAPQQPSVEKAKELHFPFEQAQLDKILSLLEKYPQIKEYGYVFTDHQLLNNELIVFDKSMIRGFPVQVHWIDYRQKKYVEKDFYPVYYTELINRFAIDLADFEELRRKMTSAYVEGVINQADKKYFFLNTKMGRYQGFIYTELGRKGLGDTFMMNDVEMKIVKELGKNWFGFVYP